MFGGGDAPASLLVLGMFPYTHSIRNCDQNVMYGVKLASIFDDGVINLLLLLYDLQNNGNTHHQEFQRRSEEVMGPLSHMHNYMPGVLAALKCLSKALPEENTKSIQTSGEGISKRPKIPMSTTTHRKGTVMKQKKRHPCHLCGRSFSKPSKLKRHEVMHTGYRPYKCFFPGCSKSYTRKDHLTRHTQVHEPNKK